MRLGVGRWLPEWGSGGFNGLSTANGACARAESEKLARKYAAEGGFNGLSTANGACAGDLCQHGDIPGVRRFNGLSTANGACAVVVRLRGKEQVWVWFQWPLNGQWRMRPQGPSEDTLQRAREFQWP